MPERGRTEISVRPRFALCTLAPRGKSQPRPMIIRHMPRILFYCLLILGCLLGQALEVQAQSMRRDTNYVKELPGRVRINTGLRAIYDEATFTAGDQEFSLENKTLAYRIGGRYGLPSYTFSIPISDLGTGTDEDESGGWGLGLRLFRRYGYLRTQFRFTDGFRLTGPDGSSEFRKDIRLFSAYLYGYHLFNHQRYSMRASFNQRDVQLENQGSWLLGGLITRRRLLSDSLVVSVADDEFLSLERFAQTSVGIGGGYAYTLLPLKNFYITPVLYAGPELRFTAVGDAVTGKRREATRFGLQLRARMAVGYNDGKYFAALIGDYIPSKDRPRTIRTQDVRSQLELRIGVQW